MGLMPASIRPLTALELNLCVAELSPRVLNGELQNAWQVDLYTLIMSVRCRGENVFLSVCTRSGEVRLGEVSGKPEQAEPPRAVVQYARAVLCGTRIVSLTQPGGDRVVHLTTTAGVLVAELFGHTPTVLITRPDGVIAVSTRAGAGGRPLGPPHLYEPPPPRSTSELDPTSRFQTAREVEAFFAELAEARALDGEHDARLALFSGARSRLARLRERLGRDREQHARFEDHLRSGELLKSVSSRLRRGQTEVEVTDWYVEGAPPRILLLDPKLDGRENVEVYFKRHRKGRDGVVRIDARLTELTEIEELMLALEVGEVPDVEVLRDLRRWGLASKAPRAPTPGAASKKPEKRLPYRTFISQRDERILVGRGGADNHVLTFRVARGNDLWLHVRDAPGAHVIVPQPSKSVRPHAETVADAAALAAFHSDLRGERAVDVTLTERKHVRAVPGGPPGRVTVSGAKTVAVDDIEARIERLFARVRESGAEGT